MTDDRKAGAAAKGSQQLLFAAALLVWPLGLGALALLRRAPDAVEDRKYSLFKTVNAMRGQQGYRLRP